MLVNPRNTVFALKNLLGMCLSSHVKDLVKVVPFKIIARDNNGDCNLAVEVNVGGEIKVYSVVELLSLIIREIKEIAEDLVDEKINCGVYSTPSYFSSDQRYGITSAAYHAGLEYQRYLKDPYAAHASVSRPQEQETCHSMIFVHLGGFTMQISLIGYEEGFYELISSEQLENVGGHRYNQRLLSHLTTRFNQKHKVNAQFKPADTARIEVKVEREKLALSS
jgi:molecular chaperone DnaK (HSP70)